MSIKFMAKLEETRVNALKDTIRLRYQTRLNPKMFPGSKWNDCTSKTYFNALKKGLFGGFVEARTLNEDGKEV
jgi:hypothetical protein